MNDVIWKTRRIPLVIILLLLQAVLYASCGTGQGMDNSGGWEDDPIVPGYSMAEINIGDPFSAVEAVHGNPVERRKDGGYLYAYYYRVKEEGGLDDPGAWNLVVTMYDNDNGYLDPDDEVGAIEVSEPYIGLTSGDIGLGSTPQEVEEEFGPCEVITQTEGPKGERLQLYSYAERGVDFLVSGRNKVITVMVTAYGGLRSVDEKSSGLDAQGGLFGLYQEAPILPGQTVAGINIGDDFRAVKEKYGSPDSTGSTTEGFVYATYTGGGGSWKLNVYLEDLDKSDTLGDFDTVVSVSVRHPYAGRTPMGVGIGSSQSDVTKEFGTPERETTTTHQGEEAKIMEYNSSGIVFAISMPSAVVVEIDVNRPLTNP